MWGISSIISAVEDVAHDVLDAGSAVNDAVHDLNPLSSVFDAVGLDNITDAAETMVGAAVDGTFGFIKDGVEGLEKMGDGVGEMLKGNFLGGLEEIGSGLVDSTVGASVDAFLFSTAKSIGAIQQLTGTEAEGRKLSPTEKAELQKVYGDSIDYDSVKIVEGDTGIMTVGDAARTIGNTIYIPKSMLPLTQSLLTHEMGHVWQFQNGGDDYMREALWGQYVGDGYDFEKGIKEGKSFSELNPEQQADLMRELYNSGFAADPAGHPFMIDGVDYSAYALEALREVRSGEGAP